MKIINRIKSYFFFRSLRKRYRMTPDGERLTKYLADKLDGTADYSIAKFDEMIENMAERSNEPDKEVAKEKAMALLLLSLMIIGGKEEC